MNQTVYFSGRRLHRDTLFQLKNCPFCGGGASIKETQSEDQSLWPGAKVECNYCEACGPHHLDEPGGPSGATQAVEAWNKRVP